MNIRTSDILILKLIEYLIRRNAGFSVEENFYENLLNHSSTLQGFSNEKNLNQLRQKLSAQINHIQSTLKEINTAIEVKGHNQYLTNPATMKQVPQGELETFVNVIDDLTHLSETKLREALPNAFLIANQMDYYLWSNVVQNTVSIVVLYFGQQGLAAKSLATLGNFVLSELSGGYHEPATLMQILDKRFREYYEKHKSLPQDLAGAAILVNRKEAKISFSARNMDLFGVEKQKHQKYPGLSGTLGQGPTANFNEQELSIKRGLSFYCTNAHHLPNGFTNILEEIAENSISEKRKALGKWWQSQQITNLILAVTS